MSSLSDPPPILRINLGYVRAWVLQAEGNLEESAAILEDILALAEASGEGTTRMRQMLAQTFRSRGSWARAIETFEALISECVDGVGSEHPECIRLEADLAFTLLKKGEIERARALFDRLVVRARVTFSRGYVGEIDSLLNNAAGAYERVGLYDAAQELFEEVHASRLERLGPDHPLTAHPLNNLGNVFVSLKDWDQAEENFAGALVILEKAHGPTHLHVSFPVYGLAQVARGRGDVESEIRFFRRVAEIRAAADASPESRATAWLELTYSLMKAPGNEAAARVAAEASRAALELAKDEEGEDLEEVRVELRRWFEEHPG